MQATVSNRDNWTETSPSNSQRPAASTLFRQPVRSYSMPKKEIITNPDLPAGTAPLSHATRFGHLVFVQGCTGRHPSTNAVGADIKEQTRFTLDRIKMILEGAEASRRGTELVSPVAGSAPGNFPGQCHDQYLLCHQEGRPARVQRSLRRILQNRPSGPYHRNRELWRGRQPCGNHYHRLYAGLSNTALALAFSAL